MYVRMLLLFDALHDGREVLQVGALIALLREGVMRVADQGCLLLASSLVARGGWRTAPYNYSDYRMQR